MSSNAIKEVSLLGRRSDVTGDSLCAGRWYHACQGQTWQRWRGGSSAAGEHFPSLPCLCWEYSGELSRPERAFFCYFAVSYSSSYRAERSIADCGFLARNALECTARRPSDCPHRTRVQQGSCVKTFLLCRLRHCGSGGRAPRTAAAVHGLWTMHIQLCGRG